MVNNNVFFARLHSNGATGTCMRWSSPGPRVRQIATIANTSPAKADRNPYRASRAEIVSWRNLWVEAHFIEELSGRHLGKKKTEH